jgi:methylmalonyl-CoA mutase
MLYEHRKHDGSLPIVGVNTFVRETAAAPVEVELARATEEEKRGQLDRLADFQSRNAPAAAAALRRLQDVATGGGNVFDELMRAARVCSLGQLTAAFFEVGGQYRRTM